ncbi:hypothetical protein [Spiroplasma endosymbiont of Tiphia femorata]|uniref:hypothetical protein n=1 Tax=Spiroplasma endosymbiont of Tiphia femorata TaxID=3066326 RepID=UPI0030D5C55F
MKTANINAKELAGIKYFKTWSMLIVPLVKFKIEFFTIKYKTSKPKIINNDRFSISFHQGLPRIWFFSSNIFSKIINNKITKSIS